MDLPVGDFSEDKQPCWYADLEVADNKKDYKWKVGFKHEGKTGEYSFKFDKLGNIKDIKIWNHITRAEFAIQLINVFRSGGPEAVKKWIKNKKL
jgi:hypothetical protein